ncbi:hypothetical protein LINPERPRIM_LOCUS37334 [Linum perenne]
MKAFLDTFSAISRGNRNDLSRVEVLSCFIWKCCMSASKAVGRTSKTSILVEAVNLQSQTDPPLSEASIGDVFWWGDCNGEP